jgi:multisubunit Na+/H+ antiporter MnhC subunit
MNWFWITGILVNVALTALAIVWVVRQGKPKRGAAPDDEDSSS